MFEENLPIISLSTVQSILQEYSSVTNINFNPLFPNDIISLDQLINQFNFLRQLNNSLYAAFKNFIQQRFVFVENLIELISIDIVDDTDDDDDKEKELTKKQFNVLIQNKELLMLKFESALTMETIRQLVNEPSSSADDDNNDKKSELIYLLYKRLLVTNSKSFYKKIVSECQREANKYKFCIEWMNKNEEENEKEEEEEKPSNVGHGDDVDDLSLFRTQFLEMRSAVVNLVGTFDEQIVLLTNRFEEVHSENKAVQMKMMERAMDLELKVSESESELTAKTKENQSIRNDVNFCLETMKSMRSFFNASMKRQEELLTENLTKKFEDLMTSKLAEKESVQHAMKQEIQQLTRQVQKLQNEKSQAQKSQQEKVVALEKKLQKCNSDSAKGQAEMKKQISMLTAETKGLKTTSTTSSHTKPTTLANVVWLGMPPLVADANGHYPLVDWTKLTSQIDYRNNWQQICLNKSTYFLDFPFLLLPPQLGGWVIQLFIGSIDGLHLFGGIRIHERNTNCLPSIKVHFSFTINVEGINPFVLNKKFDISKNTLISDDAQRCRSLGAISGSVGKSWPLPTVSVKVFV